MKPGYKTSEFWLALITTIVGAMLASGLVAEGSQVAKIGGMIMGLLSQLGYNYSRLQLKKGA